MLAAVQSGRLQEPRDFCRDVIPLACADGGPSRCGVQAGFFDIDERLKDLSAKGDDLERLKGLVDFEMFRPALRQAVPRSDGSKGGRPPFDHVLMFKILVFAEHAFAVGRALRIPHQGPVVVHALPRSGARRRGAGREHDLDVSARR